MVVLSAARTSSSSASSSSSSLALLLLLLVTARAARVPGDTRPNIILFYPDTLRAESHGAYGVGLPGLTPHFDAFAETGTLFEQAHVAHTQCSPSRATMMTGRYMHVLGHRTQIHLVRAYEENYCAFAGRRGCCRIREFIYFFFVRVVCLVDVLLKF